MSDPLQGLGNINAGVFAGLMLFGAALLIVKRYRGVGIDITHRSDPIGTKTRWESVFEGLARLDRK